MRLGKLLGLKWGDIDFDESQLHVGRTISKEAFPETRQHPGDSKHLYPHSPDTGRSQMELLADVVNY